MCESMHKYRKLCFSCNIYYVEAPNVDTNANCATVPVLSAIVGIFGALTLTAIVAAFLVCVCKNKKTKGRISSIHIACI